MWCITYVVGDMGNVTVNAISFAGVGLYHYCAVGCSLQHLYLYFCLYLATLMWIDM